MLTGDENIVDVDFVVFWRIRDAAEYLFNIQNPETTVKEVAESAMREIVGQSNIQPILTEARQKTEAAVQKLMQDTLDRYKAGIRIDQVQLQKVDPPASVIDAFRDVQAARADQQRLQNEAFTYANRIVPEARGEAERTLQGAEGYKQQTVAEANGQASRFLKIYEEYAQSARGDAPAHVPRDHGAGAWREPTRSFSTTRAVRVWCHTCRSTRCSAAQAARKQLTMRAFLATIVVLLGIAALGVYFSLFIVHQNEQVLVLEFGKPTRVIQQPGPALEDPRRRDGRLFRQAHSRHGFAAAGSDRVGPEAPRRGCLHALSGSSIR